MSFANKLKQCRLRKGQSLQEVADDLGISKAHFWELETGKSRNPSTDILIKLSNHFGVSIGWLLGEEETSTEDDKMKVLFRGLQTLDPADVDLIQSMVNNFNDRKK
jgi:transcriptional regulator with XRE-family HTH domain